MLGFMILKTCSHLSRYYPTLVPYTYSVDLCFDYSILIINLVVKVVV